MRVCVAQSEEMLKKDINRWSSGMEMTLTSSLIIKRSCLEVGGAGGRGSDEVRVSALKLCQEVCVWANEMGEEALSQEAWPRERPVELASPPHTHVTFHTPPLCWSHNTCSQASASHACAQPWVHTLACCACIHQ